MSILDKIFGPGEEYKAKVREIEDGINRLGKLDTGSEEYTTLFNKLAEDVRGLGPKDQKKYSDILRI